MYCILNAAASHLETIFVIIKFFDMIKICRGGYSVSKRLNLQPAKQGLFSLTPEAVFYMNFV